MFISVKKIGSYFLCLSSLKNLRTSDSDSLKWGYFIASKDFVLLLDESLSDRVVCL